MKYFTNTSWLFAEKILRLVVGLFIGIWVARYLGPENFGLLSYTQSSVLLFAAVAKLGLDSIVVKELLNNDQKAQSIILGTAFCLRLGGYVLVLLCLNVYVFALDLGAQETFLIFLFSIVLLFQSFNVIDFYFQSAVKSKYVVYANSIALLVVSLAKIYLLVFNYTVEYFVLMYVLESIVFAGFLLYFYNTKVTRFKYHFDKNEAYLLLKQSWPLIIWGLALQTYMRIDQIMINKYLGNTEVGFYAVAVRLTELW
ncbi:MAG: flippase, partial [Ghiorsea sp.]|nr:flippase [Ghiorsea sp.]